MKFSLAAAIALYFLLTLLFSTLSTTSSFEKKDENADWHIQPFLHASRRGRISTVEWLLEEKKENVIEFVVKENQYGKFTALHFASKEGHEEIIKLLLNVFGEEDKEKLIEYVLKENIFYETALNYALANEHKIVVKLLLNVFGKEDEKILLSQKLVLENNKKLLWDLRFITKMFKSQTKDAKKNSPLWSIFSNLPAKNTILSFIITDYYYNVFGRHGAEENILKIFSTNYNYEKIQVPTFPIIPHKKYRIILPLGIDILNGPDPISQVDGHLACGTIVKVLEVTHDTAKIEQGWIMLSNDIGKRIMAPEKDPINLKVFCFFLFISALISYCLHKIL